MGFPDAEFGITLVDDVAIAELAGRFGRAAAATDVLAFSMSEGEGAEFRGELLGDVVISVERAAAQAARRSVPIDQELRELLIHGLLHLLGMDHERPEDARRMREMEQHLRWELERLPA